jgi:lipopolysaccharide/colanic/teichoic acid biosynthesis glycosyltransferase
MEGYGIEGYVMEGCGTEGSPMPALRDVGRPYPGLGRRLPVYRFVKRAFDIAASLLGLAALSPVFLAAALAVAMEDGFPVLYRQERNGLHGRVFRMYKFRSMCRDAEKMRQSLLEKNELDGPAFKMRNDPRRTQVGKFLRRTRIDELPQLVNVLKGEMSLVGPRPLVTYETAQCTPRQRQRLSVRPGLTCYWQCSGRGGMPFNEWMELDLRYIEEMSIGTDFRILCRTLLCLLRCDAY